MATESDNMAFWLSHVHPAAAKSCTDLAGDLDLLADSIDFVLFARILRVADGPDETWQETWESRWCPHGWSAGRNRIAQLMRILGTHLGRSRSVGAWVAAVRERIDGRVVGASLSFGGTSLIETPAGRRTIALATWCSTGPECATWRNLPKSGKPHVMVRICGGRGAAKRTIVFEGSTEMGASFRDMLQSSARVGGTDAEEGC